MKSWRLEDLYDAKRLGEIPQSVSSRWWRCAHTGFVDPPTQHQVYVSERHGGAFVFTLAGGTFAYAAGRATCTAPAGPVSATFHP